jgi:large subunit ribosomal protein L4
MIDISVLDKEGKEVDTVSVEESVFGGRVRYDLLKQAIVMYHANKHIRTAATKSRGMVAGSGKKLYRQKGTGHARVGNSRTHKRVGGGVAFAKKSLDPRKRMPKKQRRLACDSALLSKLKSGNVVLVDSLEFAEPKTKELARILGNLKIDRSCVVGTAQREKNIYLSARNIPGIDVMLADEFNAGDICRTQKVLMTKEAFTSMVAKRQEN